MSATVMLGLLAATALFWGVGLYNRLMRLSDKGMAAFGLVEKDLKSFASLLAAQFPDEEGSFIPLQWSELVSSVKALDAQCRSARTLPFVVEPLRTLGQTMDEIEAAWNRLREEPADLAGPTVPEVMQKLWDEAATQVRNSREGFNQAVDRYNEALNQFPARAVVGLMGFRHAGNL